MTSSCLTSAMLCNFLRRLLKTLNEYINDLCSVETIGKCVFEYIYQAVIEHHAKMPARAEIIYKMTTTLYFC